MALNIKAFAKWLIDRARDMGVKLVLNSSEIAKWAADNPAAAAAMLKTAGAIIQNVKGVDFAGLMKAVAQARLDGASMKEILGGLAKGAWKGSGGAKAVGIGAAKIAAIAAAAAFAKETVKHAGEAWNAQTEDISESIKEGNVGRTIKNVWELAWETSIPVATFRQFQSFGRWITGKSGKSNDDAGLQSSGKSQERQSKDLTAKYKKDAESHMVTKPSNPAAAHEWEKEQNRRVEINMSKENRNKKSDSTKKNSPIWYWQGKASKILASTLTWSTIKQYVSGAKFMTSAVMKVDLTIPTEYVSATTCKIHHEVQSNIEILYQALRGKNTGAYTYTEEEVYWYVVNLASLIAKVRMLHKVLAISNTRSFEVKDIHKHLMVGLKGDRNSALTLLTDIINNKASYVAQINDLAKDLNTFAYLDSTLLSRWNYIADKAIQDYNGPKAVKGVYAIHYAPALDASGNIIMEALFATNTTITTFSTYIGYVKTHLQRFMDKVGSLSPTSGLAARISGDMIKLLGATSKTFGNVPYITGSEALTFEYDAEAVDQLRNAKMLPYTPQVAPYAGTAITAPNFSVGNGGTATSINLGEYGSNDRVITTDRNKEFVAAENIQMVQFQANVNVSAIASNSVKVYTTEAGTTNLNRMTITSYSNNTTIEYYTISGLLDVDNALQYGGGSTDCQGFVSKTLPLLVQCDFCPRIQIVAASGTSITAPAVYCDLDNYAFMSERQYKDLNTVAVYSQYFYFNPEDVNIKGILE